MKRGADGKVPLTGFGPPVTAAPQPGAATVAASANACIK